MGKESDADLREEFETRVALWVIAPCILNSTNGIKFIKL